MYRIVRIENEMKRIIKKQIKNLLCKVKGKGISGLSDEKTKRAEIISFDVFDTLIVRNVREPVDLFDLVEQAYNREYPKLTIEGFREKRIAAERKAREKTKHIVDGKTKYKEITYDEIYAELKQVYGEICGILKSKELQLELDVCQANNELQAFYMRMQKLGKRIVIVSDMYLPRDAIEKILYRCGYNGYEKLFVSSEYGKMKADGSLFEEVRRECFIADPSQLLHIGDHPWADDIIPHRQGIKTYLYKKKYTELEYFPVRKAGNIPAVSVITKCIQNNCKFEGLSERVGIQVLGPMLLGYALWLNRLVREEGINTILFLSREGALLKEAYDIVENDNEVNEVYVHVSRLALCRAAVCTISSYEELINLFGGLLRGVRSLHQLLDILGLTTEKNEIANAISVDLDVNLDQIKDKDRLFHTIVSRGDIYFQNQNDFLIRYINQKGIRDKKVLLSDVGWSGTMQMLLQRLIPTVTWVGAYFGVSSQYQEMEYTRLDRRGYWFSAEEWEQTGCAVRFTASAFETLFLNSEGTTLEYKSEGNQVVPVFADTSIDEFVDRKDQSMKAAARLFLRTCNSARVVNLLGEIPAEVACRGYMNFMVKPDYDALVFMSDYKFIDGNARTGILPRHSLVYYFWHLGELKDELNQNTSKIIWFRALFKIPLPYLKICVFLTKRLGMKTDFNKKYLSTRNNKCLFSDSAKNDIED